VRKLVLLMGMSLDRLVARPGRFGAGGWDKEILAWGGAAFARSLSRLGLVDEYRLILQPAALGDGLPLFKDLSTPLRLELIDAQTYPTGAALHIAVLRPRRPKATGSCGSQPHRSLRA
jgi:dihydrofolate reductase